MPANNSDQNSLAWIGPGTVALNNNQPGSTIPNNPNPNSLQPGIQFNHGANGPPPHPPIWPHPAMVPQNHPYFPSPFVTQGPPVPVLNPLTPFQTFYTILKDPPTYIPTGFQFNVNRMILLEVQLLGPPKFLNNKPVYVTAVLHLPLHPETCVLQFNQTVIGAVQLALEQHYFDQPGLTTAQCASSGIIRFALGLKNAWTDCPILGMMGGRVYLSPAHFIGYMMEFVVSKAPRVPLHVEVEILHGEELSRELTARRQTGLREQLDNRTARNSLSRNAAKRPRVETPTRQPFILNADWEEEDEENEENDGQGQENEERDE